ncbi:hypothetical protein C8A03DRAFT_16940 [Achaetomium macrosporum]|uniref:Uncharacterized protein n=1 Tax=Achaetomium macrosporum TaxID=79813 RepID=A0AAN7HDG7_9PEZI|nr:hypothetical protein C8A03DRAFT_16940 [Achaetomium macrosporum]
MSFHPQSWELDTSPARAAAAASSCARVSLPLYPRGGRFCVACCELLPGTGMICPFHLKLTKSQRDDMKIVRAMKKGVAADVLTTSTMNNAFSRVFGKATELNWHSRGDVSNADIFVLTKRLRQRPSLRDMRRRCSVRFFIVVFFILEGLDGMAIDGGDMSGRNEESGSDDVLDTTQEAAPNLRADILEVETLGSGKMDIGDCIPRGSDETMQVDDETKGAATDTTAANRDTKFQLIHSSLEESMRHLNISVNADVLAELFPKISMEHPARKDEDMFPDGDMG